MWRELKNVYHLGQAVAANWYYRYPAKKLTVIGVTGTDGKTTTASLIYHILKTAKKKTALISTVGAYIGPKVYDIGFHVTNPASFPLQKFIKQVVYEGNEYLVLEVTSHGLDQNRVWGIPFEIAVLTNVTHEHLDYHGTFEAYMNTKLRLFQSAKTCVLNADEAVFPYFFSQLSEKHIVTYSKTEGKGDVTPQSLPSVRALPGEYNQKNGLAAWAAVKELGLGAGVVKEALSTYKLPVGRLETVQDKPFRVIIDFAHTPNAFAKVLPVVKTGTTGRLIHVFGSAGKRDRTKRPLMGQESSRYSDIIILTAEDPRDESVENISWEIARGFQGSFTKTDGSHVSANSKNKYVCIDSRQEAIERAVQIAQPGDTILLTGKAHEKSMNYGHGEEPWDEFATVKAFLKTK